MVRKVNKKRHVRSVEGQFIKDEFYNIGCGSCKFSNQDKRDFRWKCDWKIEGYPNKNKRNCKFYKNKYISKEK